MRATRAGSDPGSCLFLHSRGYAGGGAGYDAGRGAGPYPGQAEHQHGEGALADIDAKAARHGMTRSGFLVRAARPVSG